MKHLAQSKYLIKCKLFNRLLFLPPSASEHHSVVSKLLEKSHHFCKDGFITSRKVFVMFI